jgi:hypothetical protein
MQEDHVSMGWGAARNDQHYDALVGRAAAIERSLGLPDGAFANRPRAWLKTARIWPVGHRNSVALIYAASVALWLFGCLALALEVGYDLLDKGPDGSDPPAWTAVVLLTVSTAATVAATLVIKRGREAREKQLRSRARQAVELVERFVRSEGITGAGMAGLRALAEDEKPPSGPSGERATSAHENDLVVLCELAGAKRDIVKARLRFFSKLDPVSLRVFLPGGAMSGSVASPPSTPLRRRVVCAIRDGEGGFNSVCEPLHQADPSRPMWRRCGGSRRLDPTA